MPGGKTEAGAKGGKEVVVIGRFVFGGDADYGSGGGTYRGGGGDGRDGDGEGDGDGRIIKLEDNVANITSGTEPNDTLVYAPVLDINYPIVSTLGVYEGQLDRERDIYYK